MDVRAHRGPACKDEGLGLGRASRAGVRVQEDGQMSTVDSVFVIIKTDTRTEGREASLHVSGAGTERAQPQEESGAQRHQARARGVAGPKDRASMMSERRP